MHQRRWFDDGGIGGQFPGELKCLRRYELHMMPAVKGNIRDPLDIELPECLTDLVDSQMYDH